jgi:hypothetical protein
VTAAHLTVRKRRLVKLVCGLSREAAFIRTAPCRLLWLERRASIDAPHAACAPPG